MTLQNPPLPTPAQLIAARNIAANPAAFLGLPDFIFLINNAWWALKADQLDRMERAKAAVADDAA